jgi:hypothetical protein
VCFSLLPTQRVTFKYDGSTIVPGEQGEEYEHFVHQCTGRGRIASSGRSRARVGRGETEARLVHLALGVGGTRFELLEAASSLATRAAEVAWPGVPAPAVASPGKRDGFFALCGSLVFQGQLLQFQTPCAALAPSPLASQ